ncbi:hypothetical protein EIN_063020 [Entamoeba invadens IP1]|uniref:hypothetical protein n=1 Tax=Entamoeba invadens IP1 TaxID=370355 RepID=UPI0002C3F4A2|nr:hypothetical protein EIN_063020 [Entamoeba invadens IP1]ELP93587.1 hypothetical protein EIN_063020 [Entamoeba invadens IP1]|eukprot:XP_004260358.1 hypothetical protein EIN_063020 [Entamoeba invadens IP1]
MVLVNYNRFCLLMSVSQSFQDRPRSLMSAFRFVNNRNYSVIPPFHSPLCFGGKKSFDQKFGQNEELTKTQTDASFASFQKNYQSNFQKTESQDDMNSSRTWTEKTTKYVLLKYFYWKFTEPSVMSLHEMYKTISASVALDLAVSKTSTQIRDKINNIKSGFKKDQKSQDSDLKDINSLKYISPALYDVMNKYFDETKARGNYNDVLKEINDDIYRLTH